MARPHWGVHQELLVAVFTHFMGTFASTVLSKIQISSEKLSGIYRAAIFSVAPGVSVVLSETFIGPGGDG